MVSFLRTQHSVSEHPNVTACCISQLNFSFYRNQPIRADFCRGQITSEAGLLPLRGFDQRHHLTRDWAACLADPRRQDRVEPGAPSFRGSWPLVLRLPGKGGDKISSCLKIDPPLFFTVSVFHSHFSKS
jgi:hypothetical protein